MFYPFYYYLDPTYILILIGVILSLVASAKVKSTFAKYAKVRNSQGFTGAQAAQRVLERAGIYDVRIEHVSGNLTDHYDPKSKVLRLSDSVYGQSTVAAVGSEGMLWILLGGISYTVGAVFYAVGGRSLRYMHSVFHIFTVLGTVLQFFAIYCYGL